MFTTYLLSMYVLNKNLLFAHKNKIKRQTKDRVQQAATTLYLLHSTATYVHSTAAYKVC